MDPYPEEIHGKVLIVDDEESVRESLAMLMEDRYFTFAAEGGEAALRILRKHQVDLVVLDLSMPGMGGMETLGRIGQMRDRPETIILSASDSARLGAEAIRKGAFDYVTKPFDAEVLLETVRKALHKRSLEREVSYLRSEVEKLGGFGNIVGKSPQMQQVFETLEKVIRSDSNVLITGESGTGKELIARAIHSRGPRSRGPFIPVNCAAIPQELLESEFFGHEKGSFTGAHRSTVGKFELAHKGILFLDEISTLRKELQAKLLRVLQERVFDRVGGKMPIRVDVQIVAATNQNLRQMVEDGNFREDLYYRLNVLPINLPPLRDRKRDIPILVDHFLREICYRLNRKCLGITKLALKELEQYPWPGNARELENLLERMVVFSNGETPIDVESLPVEITLHGLNASHGGRTGSDGLAVARDRFERMYILSALKRAGWNQSEAARLLKVHRNTLLKKMSALRISVRQK